MSELADAIDRFFDRVPEVLPKFVPKAPSRWYAARIAAGLFSIGVLAALTDRRMTYSAINPAERHRWSLILLANLYVTVIVYNAVQQFRFNIDSYSVNAQHFANLDWIGRYKLAFS